MAGAYAITRWPERALPEMLVPLMAEAVAGGYHWMDELPAEWDARPMLEPGEGLFIASRDGEPAAMAIISRDP